MSANMSRRPWAINRQPDAAQDTSSPIMEGPGSPSQDERSPPDDAPKSTNKRSSEQSSAELRYPRKRSIRACHLCRARKTKCDNVQPTCGFCASIGANCSYDGKQHDHSSFDSASLEILRKLSELAEGQSELIRLLRSVTNVQSPPQFSPAPNRTISAPLAGTPGSTHATRREIDTLPATSPSEFAGPSYNRFDRLVQASIGSSALPVRDGREGLGAFAQNQLSPQEYYEVGSDAAAAQGNPAALRWFDLLANDAGKDSLPAPPSQTESEPARGFHQGHNNAEATPLQRATRIIDADLRPNNVQEPYDQLSDVGDTGPSRWLRERRLWQAEEDIQLLPREQILFDIFMHRISSMLDLFDPRRTFSAVVSRQAVGEILPGKEVVSDKLQLRNAGLMNAVLAVSCHYASVDPESNAIERNDHHTPLQYYDQTLHYVQKAMRYSSYQTSKELLATTLTISIYEMLTGSRKDWDRHLQGVFWILRSQKIDVETDGVESAVWWAWLRQDIWAAFREKRMTYTTWRPTKSYAELSPYEHASRSVWIMAQVVSFCCFDMSGINGSARINERLERARELHHMLEDWNKNMGVEFAPLPARPHDGRSPFRPISIHPSCFGIAVQVHHVSKILVCMNEPTLGGHDDYVERLRTVQPWIRIVCGIGMTLTDEASSMMSSQFLFIAGLFAQDERERAAIVEMIDAASERSGWWAGSLGEDLMMMWAQQTMPGTNGVGH